jgi:hypothetical protein
MTILECRRDRLVHVLDLARMYRGWSRQEVAAALGREASKIVPASGNPKLDLVVGLARLLEWQVGEVAECLWGKSVFDDLPELPAAMDGDARAVVLLSAARRCRAAGHYQHAIERLQQALMERALSLALRSVVQAELAEAHYTLWHLAEARALASELLRHLDRLHAAGAEPQEIDPSLRPAAAMALAVRGQAHRRLMRLQPELADQHARSARADLVAALSSIDAILRPCDSDATASSAPTPEPCAETLLALANTAQAGIVECDVELAALAPDEGVAQLHRGLDAVIDPASMTPDAMLESWGWWSVVGANLVLAHFAGATQLRFLAIFTNKALEIADRTGNWALRERAFMLEHLRRSKGTAAEDESDRAMLDQDDVRSIIGAMGRFANFREAGWALLRDATILE